MLKCDTYYKKNICKKLIIYILSSSLDKIIFIGNVLYLVK